MVAKQGETIFAIRDQEGTASNRVDQKWHMISAEQVGDSGSVIWQHAETGLFRETKYSIDKNQKTWTQNENPTELNTQDLYSSEGQHKKDLNADGFLSSSQFLLSGPGKGDHDAEAIEAITKPNSTDQTQKTWAQNQDQKALSTQGLNFSEEQHKDPLDSDDSLRSLRAKWQKEKYTNTGNIFQQFVGSWRQEFQIARQESTKKDLYIKRAKADILLEGDSLTSKQNPIVGTWKVNRNADFSIEGEHKDEFKINEKGEVSFTGESLQISQLKGPGSFLDKAGAIVKLITIKATDKTTNQSIAKTVTIEERQVLEVTNNKGGEEAGSLGFAVNRANELGRRGISSEIRFSKSMTIRSRFGYKFEAGDVKLNLYNSRNISIQRTTNGPAITIGELKYARYNAEGIQPDLKVETSNINIFGTKSKGVNAKQNSGSGGGAGGGSAILHFNGHVKWANSVFQGNKVEGGDGAKRPDSGADAYYRLVKRYSAKIDATNGSPSFRGGHFPDQKNSFKGQIEGGQAPTGSENINARNGANAPDAENPGEGGIAGSAPSGRGVTREFLSRKQGAKGTYGKKGKAGWAGGEAVGPGDGSAEWGGKADPDKGGRGGATGVITSIAHDNAKNSFQLRNTAALGNESHSSESAGKFNNIVSRFIPIKVDNHRQHENPDTGYKMREVVKPGAPKKDLDIKQTHDNYANFEKLEGKKLANTIVRSNSFNVNATEANIEGRRIVLDPNQQHLVFTGMDTKSGLIATAEVKNWENWRNSISGMMDKVFAVRTEEEIRGSRKSFWQHIEPLATKYLSKLPGLTMLPDVIAPTKVIDSILSEEQSIQRQIKEREDTIKEHDRLKKELVELSASIQTRDKRTADDIVDFTLGKHGNYFQPGINPELKWKQLGDGRAFIQVEHTYYDSKESTNHANIIQRITLNAQQAKDMGDLRDNTERGSYLNNFIQRIKINGSTSAVLGTHTRWLAIKDNRHPLTGPGNDRVYIDRKYREGFGDRTNLKIYTYQGDDTIDGDQGDSTINAGTGDDYIRPGLGVDTVKGGAGSDTVDYSNVDQALTFKASRNGVVKVKFANTKEQGKMKMDDTITGVERFKIRENAVVDFKDAPRPVEYATTDPTRTTNKESHYAFSIKQNTSFEGSDYDDKISINFDVKEGASNAIDLIKKATIDGRGGINEFSVKGLDPLLKQGYYVINDESENELMLTNGSKRKAIVGYRNFMGSPKVYDQNNQEVELKSKASIAPSMDIDEELDVLTNYMASHEPTKSTSTRQLNTDQLILSTGGLALGQALESLKFEPTNLGISITQDPVNMILGNTSNSHDNGLNTHHQRDLLSHDRTDNF